MPNIIARAKGALMYLSSCMYYFNSVYSLPIVSVPNTKEQDHRYPIFCGDFNFSKFVTDRY